MDMRAGTLKHYISIQEKTSTSDGMGGYTDVWNPIYSCRAAIWSLSANERLDTMKLEVAVDHRIRIRHPREIVEITEKHRIKWHDPMTGTDKYFYIISVINPDKSNKMLELIAREEV